jgi:glycosyltransferase involved in cell wall biosynthesis
MNILVLAAEYPPQMHGGLANYSYNVAKNLAKTNNVRIAALPNYLRSEKPGGSNLYFIYDVVIEINRLKKERRDIVVYAIAFRPEFSIIGAYAKMVGVPFVCHGVGWDIYTSHPAFIFARRLAYLVCNELICGASFQKQIMANQGGSAKKIHVILGGVDTEMFKPLHNERDKLRRLFNVENMFVLLSLGRLIKRKGFDDAIKALTYLQDIKDIRLLIVGEGPEKHTLIKLVKALHLKNKVQFLGFVPPSSLLHVYNIADVFVAPFKILGRDMEGFPLVVQEAQACGVPVISTLTGSLPELIENNVSGFLVNAESPSEIAEKIRALHQHPHLCRKMGENARTRAQTLLSWKVTIAKIENVLHATLTQKNNP